MLFHGSPNVNLTKLSPQQTEDNDSDSAFNIDIAVFATRSACEAIIYSVINFSLIPKSVGMGKSFSVNNEGLSKIYAKIPKVWEQYIEDYIGCVYVLPMETFTEFEGIHGKSKKEVIPIEEVFVKFKDYIDLGGNIEWT